MNKSLYSEKYKLVKVTSGVQDVAGFGKIDLDNLSLEEADLLYDQKFPFLEKKSKETKPAAQIEEPKV